MQMFCPIDLGIHFNLPATQLCISTQLLRNIVWKKSLIEVTREGGDRPPLAVCWQSFFICLPSVWLRAAASDCCVLWTLRTENRQHKSYYQQWQSSSKHWVIKRYIPNNFFECETMGFKKKRRKYDVSTFDFTKMSSFRCGTSQMWTWIVRTSF